MPQRDEKPLVVSDDIKRSSALIIAVGFSLFLHAAVLVAALAAEFSVPPEPLPVAYGVELVAMSPDPGGDAEGGGQRGEVPTEPVVDDSVPSVAPAQDQADIPDTPLSDEALDAPKGVSMTDEATEQPAPEEMARPKPKPAEVSGEPVVEKKKQTRPQTNIQTRKREESPPDEPQMDRESSSQRQASLLRQHTQPASPGPVGDHAKAAGIGDGAYGTEFSPKFVIGSASNPFPRYPPMARRNGIEGQVVLSVNVSQDGKPLSVDVASSSGSRLLDEAALEAVQRWRFVPARQFGLPIKAHVAVPIRFQLLER